MKSTHEPMLSRRLYRVPEAATLLSMSRSVLYEQIRAGRLGSVSHRHRGTLDRYGITDTTDVVVVNHWAVTGFGYRTDAEREIAHAIAQRLQQGRHKRGSHDRKTRS